MYINESEFVKFVNEVLSENAEKAISETNVLCRGCAYEMYDDGSMEAWEWEDGYEMFSSSDLYYEKRVRVWPDGHWNTFESNGRWQETVTYRGDKEVSRE